MGIKMNLGEKGEEIAKKYLIKNGYQIVERNYQTKFGEIDIIAKRKDTIYFVEVKTRTNRNYGRPIDAMTPYKIKHLIRSVQVYIAKKQLEGTEVSLDVIEVEKVHKQWEINHIENAIWL